MFFPPNEALERAPRSAAAATHAAAIAVPAPPGRCPSAFLASNSFFLGSGMSPSRCAFLRASFRARRIASDFSRFFRSEGFS